MMDGSDKGESFIVLGDKQQILVHGREGSYLMDKNKWPKLILPNETVVSDAT